MTDSIRHGWRWVPTTYFAEGAPFMAVTAVAPVLLASIGMDNRSMAFWTGLLMLPWTVKPLWAPALDFFGTKRGWIIGCQLVLAFFFALGALFLGTGGAGTLLLGALFFVAFASATHDVAADGFYMIALDSHGQSFFAGIRSTFYRMATVSVQGGLVALAGLFVNRGWAVHQGWSVSFSLSAVVLLLLGAWHFLMLPRVETPVRAELSVRKLFGAFLESVTTFFRLPKVWKLILFLFFFRMAEVLLGKMSGVFLIAKTEAGGLGLSLAEQGFFCGTVGVIALTAGGILGGIAVARYGLRRTAWLLAAALNLPDFVYVYLAATQTTDRWRIGSCIAFEQFGYGLGYTVFMMVMLAAAANSGKYRTTHFAFMTALSILAMSLFGMTAGALQEAVGYLRFFWCVIALLPMSFGALFLILKEVPLFFGKR